MNSSSLHFCATHTVPTEATIIWNAFEVLNSRSAPYNNILSVFCSWYANLQSCNLISGHPRIQATVWSIGLGLLLSEYFREEHESAESVAAKEEYRAKKAEAQALVMRRAVETSESRITARIAELESRLLDLGYPAHDPGTRT